jgi:hypothetical protein
MKENILSDLVPCRSLPIFGESFPDIPGILKAHGDYSKQDFLNVLKKCRDGLISYEDLENWADAIELRDDIGFEADEMLEIIFELANPDINGQLSKERLEEMIKELS